MIRARISAAVTIGVAITLPALAQDRVPGEAWLRYADPAEAGFDPEAIESLRTQWESAQSSAFMIVRGGAVVASWGEPERRFMCHSVRKSFLSGLYGIAYDAGAIELNKTMAELGIDDIEDGLTDLEKQARILDLLKARSGVYRLAAYEPPQNPKPPRHSHAPGTFWCYNNWDFNTLSTIYRDQIGRDVFEAFDEEFAGPLGMQDYRVSDGYYHLEPEKSEHPAYPFRMSARDMARYGLLFVREGMWGDERILSRNWVRRSTASYSDGEPFSGGYGFMWWVFSNDPVLRDAGAYSALGVGNQAIAVAPELDLVVINRANTYDGQATPGPALLALMRGVIEAIETDVAAEPELISFEPDPTDARYTEVSRAALEPFLGEFDYPAPGIGPAQTTVSIEAGPGALSAFSSFNGRFLLFLQPDGSFVEEDSQRVYVPWRSESGELLGFVGADGLASAAVGAAARGDDATSERATGLLKQHFGDRPESFATSAALLAARGDADGADSALGTALDRWPDRAQLTEDFVNAAGYRLMQANALDAALLVFELNTRVFPGSWNVWDSLGEAHMTAGNRDEAIRFYQRSIELNPQNTNGATTLERLRDGG